MPEPEQLTLFKTPTVELTTGKRRYHFASKGKRNEPGNLIEYTQLSLFNQENNPRNSATFHILIQVANYFGKKIYAFTRQGDWRSQQFAQELGAVWVGDSTTSPPEPLDAAIIFAPVGALVPIALKSLVKGGIVVCAGIHMSDIPSFPYHLLWEERLLRSVANLTRQDGEEFLALAPQIPIQTQVNPFPLEQANEALEALRQGQIDGSVVLTL